MANIVGYLRLKTNKYIDFDKKDIKWLEIVSKKSISRGTVFSS